MSELTERAIVCCVTKIGMDSAAKTAMCPNSVLSSNGLMVREWILAVEGIATFELVSEKRHEWVSKRFLQLVLS